MSVQNKNRCFNRSLQGQKGLIDSASYHPLPHIQKGDWSPYKNNLLYSKFQSKLRSGRNRTRAVTVAPQMTTNITNICFVTWLILILINFM